MDVLAWILVIVLLGGPTVAVALGLTFVTIVLIWKGLLNFVNWALKN